MKAIDVAGRIKSLNLSWAPSNLRIRHSAPPPKPPSNSAMKAKSLDVTPATPLTHKRAFSHSTIADLDDSPIYAARGTNYTTAG